MIDPLTIFSGITLSIIAAFCFNYSIILNKKGLLQGLPDINFDQGVKSVVKSFISFFKNRDWTIGFFLGVIGYLPYLISMNLVGIVVTQPVTSVGLVVLVYFAHKKLNEKIGYTEIASIALMIGGTILIAFAQVSDIFIEILNIALSLILFNLLLIGISICLYIVALKYKGKGIESVLIMIIGGMITAIGSILSGALILTLNSGVFFTIPLLGIFEIFFGIFWFEVYHIWAFISWWGLIIFNIIGFTFVQAGLQRGKAVLVFPISNTINLIIPLVAGLFIFQQTFQNYILFFLGVISIMIATIILSRFQAKIEKIETLEKEKE